MTNNNTLPFPLSSYWGRLSISVGFVWMIIFLFGLYKLILRERRFAYHDSSYFSTIDTRKHFRDDDDSINVNPEDPSGSRGLDSGIVRSLPSAVFKKDEREGGGSECAICLAEFGEGEWQRVLPSCRHAFHVGCIDTWFRSRSDCPLCRKRVVCDFSSVNQTVRSLEPLPREDVCGERLLEYHSSLSV